MNILFVLVVLEVVRNSMTHDTCNEISDASSFDLPYNEQPEVIIPIINITSLTENILDNQHLTSDEIAQVAAVVNYQYGLAEKKRTTLDFIEEEGYPYENHYVITPDGYILNLHRIPFGKSGKSNNKVAYLQHGLLASSSDWVIAGAGKGLAYILAEEGYDVWMGNARGNRYSRNHTTLNPDTDSAFWLFSWHEIGKIDLPTMIDYVLSQTGADGVYYAGHSQGTTSFYVMGSTVPEYNDKIKVQVSLAPIAYMNHMKSPVMHFVATLEGEIGLVTHFLGVDEFLPSDGLAAIISEIVCGKVVGSVMCENSLFAICGFSPKQMNMTLLPSIMEQSPAGAATRQLLHYAQEIKSGKFRQYDYGDFFKNKGIYGTWTPPHYDLSKITAPVYLIYSKNDWLAGEKDVNRLAVELGNCLRKFKVADDEFNHLDFTFGMDAPNLVYKEVVNFFSKH